MQINNLARDNLHDKLDILSELVTDEFWPWFANYMVVKRAAQVSNIATSQTYTHIHVHNVQCVCMHGLQLATYHQPCLQFLIPLAQNTGCNCILIMTCSEDGKMCPVSDDDDLCLQEPNFHVLYLELMEHMNKAMMDKHLASTTFKYIKILLRSDRIKTQVGTAPLQPVHKLLPSLTQSQTAITDVFVG